MMIRSILRSTSKMSLPDTTSNTTFVEEIFDCDQCDAETDILHMYPCCKKCIKNNIITKILWDNLGVCKFENPVRFAVEYNDCVEKINDFLNHYEIEPVKKINVNTVEQVYTESTDLFKLNDAIYIS
jgi:hypothetical protein